MNIDLGQKNAIVTGASRGIGRVIAHELAAAGANIALWGRNIDLLTHVKIELETQFMGKYQSYQIDLRNFKSIYTIAKQTYHDFGSIDILVNNAGIPEYGYPIDDPSPAAENAFLQIVELNFMAYWHAIRAVVPFMKRQGGGVIVNISSARGHGGVPNQSVYCAIKAGVIMLTKALAVELAPYNIRVVSVSPGAIKLADSHWFLRRFGPEYFKKYLKRFRVHYELSFLANQPLPRAGSANDVAWAVVFLASEKASFITGIDLPVDGGETAVLAQPAAVNLELYKKFYSELRKLQAWIAKIENKFKTENRNEEA